jgi:hypothetical protein
LFPKYKAGLDAIIHGRLCRHEQASYGSFIPLVRPASKELKTFGRIS